MNGVLEFANNFLFINSISVVFYALFQKEKVPHELEVSDWTP